jgi:glycosyltransferase involved in cell wall biosynthesis
MTLLEAMCYGVPVIAPNVGGPMEIVQSGENGFTLDVRRADELDATLNNLYSHPELCAALSKGALATAGRFSSQKLKSTVTEILGN